MDHVTVQAPISDIKVALLDVNLPTSCCLCIASLGSNWIAEDQAPAPVLAPEGSLFPRRYGRLQRCAGTSDRASAAAVLMALRDGERILRAGPRF